MKMIKPFFAVIVAGLLAGDGFGMGWEKLISVSPETLPPLYKGVPLSCPLKAYKYDLVADRNVEVAASWQWAYIQCTGLSASEYSPKPGNAVSVLDYCRIGDEEDIPFVLDQQMTIDGHRFDQVLITPDYLEFVNSQDVDEYGSLSFRLTYDEDYISGFRDVWYLYDANKGTMTFYWRYVSSVSGEEYNISACLTPKDGRIDFKCDKISHIDCVWLDFWTGGDFDSYEGLVPDGSTGSGVISFVPSDVPSWLSLSSAGVLSGTPPAEMDRPIAIVGSATIDGELARQVFTYDLHVVDPANAPPQIVSTAPVDGIATWFFGAPAVMAVDAISPGNKPLTYTWFMIGTDATGMPTRTELTPENIALYNEHFGYSVLEKDGNVLTFSPSGDWSVLVSGFFQCVVSDANGSVSQDFEVKYALPEGWPDIKSISPWYGEAFSDDSVIASSVYFWDHIDANKTFSVTAVSTDGSPLAYRWYFGMWDAATADYAYRELTAANLASLNATYRSRLNVGFDLFTVNGSSLTVNKAFREGSNVRLRCEVSNRSGMVRAAFQLTMPDGMPKIVSTVPEDGIAEFDGVHPVVLHLSATSPDSSPLGYYCSYGRRDAGGKCTWIDVDEINADFRTRLGIDYDVISVGDGEITLQPVLLARDLSQGTVIVAAGVINSNGSTHKDFTVVAGGIRPVVSSVTPSTNAVLEVGCEPLVFEVDYSIANPALNASSVIWEWKTEKSSVWMGVDKVNFRGLNCKGEFTADGPRLEISPCYVAVSPLDAVVEVRATIVNDAVPEASTSVTFRWKRVRENDFGFTVNRANMDIIKSHMIAGFSSALPPTGPREIVVPCVNVTEQIFYLAEGLFRDCGWMDECWLPRTMKSISASAFSGCSALQTVHGIENVTGLGASAFENCTSLQSFSVPTGVTVVAEGLFRGCSSLKSVTLPAALKRIDAAAFSGCAALRSVRMECLEAPVVDGGAAAFAGHPDGTVVYVPLGSTGWNGTPGSPVLPATWMGMRLRAYNPAAEGFVAKAVLCDNGETLLFVCDDRSYGVEGQDWFAVASADAATSVWDIPWYRQSVCDRVTRVTFDPSFADYRPGNTAWWFCDFSALRSVTGLKHLDTVGVESMKRMFYGCSQIRDLDLSSFDTAGVVDMEEMFRYCGGLERIHASESFTTEAVTSSDLMFYSCDSIVGGNDTRYNPGYVDKTWARIGEAPNTNGYFTGTLPVPKAVVEDTGKTLRFVYDGVDYGTEGRDWYDVSAAESLSESEHPPWYSTKITKAVFDASFADYAPTGMANWFRGLGELAEIEGIGNLDTSRVASMAGLFLDCVKLKSVDLHRLNLAHVTSARAMFSGCLQLQTVYVGIDQVFAPSSSTDMFKNCFRLVGENGTVCNGVSRTDATYARRDLPGEPGYFSLFREAYAVWDAQTATLNFRFDENFSELNPVFRRWDDVVSAETEWINWSNWRQAELCTACTRVVFEPSMSDFKPTSCRCLFSSLSAVTEVSGLKWLDTHAVTDMSRMFETCNALTDVPFDGLDTSSVTNMSSMFAYCNHLEKLDVGSFDTSRVEDMSYMFSGCTRLAEIDATYLFSVAAVTKSTDMFAGCKALVGGKGTAYDSANVDKSRANVDQNPYRYGYFTAANLPYVALGGKSGQRVAYFRYDDKYNNNPARLTDGFCLNDARAHHWPLESISEVVFEPSITNWHPTSCERLFLNLYSVTNITGLAHLDTSLCTNMTSMFSGMQAMKRIDVTALDTSRVRDMSHMFATCYAATNIVLRGLDTSSVTDMSRMFTQCYVLKSVDFSGVSTRSVDNMASMFYDCSDLATLDLSTFDTSCVTNMSGMFSSCDSLATIYVSEDFVTDRVGDSSSMFFGCTSLVGGAGTPFDGAYTTATRARIDNPPDSPGYFTSVSSVLNGYAAWVAEKGLRGADAAWDAKPAYWGGQWENAFIYTYGEGLAGGTLTIMNISFDADGNPVITTAPVIEGHTDFTPAVIGTPNLQNWTSPVLLKCNGDDTWTLPLGESANFFRIRLTER